MSGDWCIPRKRHHGVPEFVCHLQVEGDVSLGEFPAESLGGQSCCRRDANVVETETQVQMETGCT